MVLSYVDGLTLAEVSDLEPTELRHMLEEAFLPLGQHGVYQDDTTLINVTLVVGERLVHVALEHVYEPDDPDDITYIMKDKVDHLLDRHKACARRT